MTQQYAQRSVAASSGLAFEELYQELARTGNKELKPYALVGGEQ